MSPPISSGKPRSAIREHGQSVIDRVVQHLEGLIFEGSLEPGSSLPSENQLSSELDVSRLTVREGIRVLEARGLIEVRHGRRPEVSSPNAVILNDFFSVSIRRDPGAMFELLEVRLAIEVHTAQLAARNATRSDLAMMEMALDTMRHQANDEDAFNQADLRFHATVASASKNRLLSLLIEGMEDPLRRSRLQSIQGYRIREEDFAELVEQHENIFEAIAQRDPESAAAHMRIHLKQTRSDLQLALSSSYGEG